MVVHKTTVCEHGFRISTCRCPSQDKTIVVDRSPCSRTHLNRFGPYYDTNVLPVPYIPKHRKDDNE